MKTYRINKKTPFVLFSFPFICYIIYNATAIPDNLLFFISNLIILFLTYVGMFMHPNKKYTLTKVVFIFAFVFFGVVPLNDEVNTNLYWGGDNIDIYFKIVTNILIILGLITYYISSQIKLSFIDRLGVSLPELKKLNLFVYILFYISIAYVILYVNNFNIYNLLFRGIVGELRGEVIVRLNQTQRLLFDNFIRSIPLVLLVIIHYYRRKVGKIFIKFDSIKYNTFIIIVTIISIILVAPTSVPRFQAAALYIPLVIVFTTLWDHPYTMQLVVLVGLFVIMPILDKFRLFNPENFNLDLNFNFLNHGHFDAYQNFVRVVELDYVTHGEQLVGAMLFFIPRSLWSSKPIGSGATIAELANYNWSNISFPFFAEGYINFGVIGVILFVFVLGLILGNIDRIAWKMKSKGENNLLLYYYYFLFGMVFFIMRGDLMSSLAYTVGLSVSFWFSVIVMRVTNLNFKL